MIRLPVSVGEAIDKWNILHIKRDFVRDPLKLQFICEEIQRLSHDIDPILAHPQIERLYRYLDYFNREIWILCDQVRVDDVNTFQQHADATQKNLYAKRCVEIIKYNDARFRIKNKINHWSTSALREQKNFGGYRIRVKLHTDVLDIISPLLWYLSMCYDEVLVQPTNQAEESSSQALSNLYKDDLNIQIVMDDSMPPCAMVLDLKKDTIQTELKSRLDIDYDKIANILFSTNN